MGLKATFASVNDDALKDVPTLHDVILQKARAQLGELLQQHPEHECSHVEFAYPADFSSNNVSVSICLRRKRNQ